jgi:HprK-related kinase B
VSATTPSQTPASVAALALSMVQATTLCADRLKLSAGDLGLVIRSNSRALLDRLAGYFSHLPHTPVRESIEILAIEGEAGDRGLPFRDWRREPGKQGRKDAILDLVDGRLLLKVRTGMLFLQSDRYRIAAGPCLENDNQVINFINAQIMSRLQQQDWLICHAAALRVKGRALAIAGFSGNGKSTLMLHMLEHRESRYLTNDRLFLRASGEAVQAVGIPKLPRVNPGTLLNNPRLVSLLSPAARERLRQLPPQSLWDLEEKYDVDVAQRYGDDRIDTSTPLPLQGLLILNWQRESREPVRLTAVDPAQRRDLLPAVMKSPGPFYRNAEGCFQQDEDPLRESDYLRVFRETEVFEVTGGTDFDLLTAICFEKWYAA